MKISFYDKETLLYSPDFENEVFFRVFGRASEWKPLEREMKEKWFNVSDEKEKTLKIFLSSNVKLTTGFINNLLGAENSHFFLNDYENASFELKIEIESGILSQKIKLISETSKYLGDYFSSSVKFVRILGDIFRGLEDYTFDVVEGEIVFNSPKKILFARGYIEVVDSLLKRNCLFKQNIYGHEEINKKKIFLLCGKYRDDEKKALRILNTGKYQLFISEKIIR